MISSPLGNACISNSFGFRFLPVYVLYTTPYSPNFRLYQDQWSQQTTDLLMDQHTYLCKYHGSVYDYVDYCTDSFIPK